jgi:HTH-type transcriptional regulator, sugar sensing transcriptional regulator
LPTRQCVVVSATTIHPDLTPFGFTGTESLVYRVLLRLGPATGYAVARAARLARANAYQALDGLVSRGAAARLPGRPARYRPTDPQVLLAQLAAAQGEALDRLSHALQDATRATEPETKLVTGARAVANVVLQLVARTERRVEGVLATELWRPTLPAWRRAAARAELELRIAGDVPAEAPELVTGTTAPDHPTVLLIDGAQALAAVGAGETLAGVWSSHPAIVALVRGVLGGSR